MYYLNLDPEGAVGNGLSSGEQVLVAVDNECDGTSKKQHRV